MNKIKMGFTSLIVLFFLWSSAANAAYICPNGPGPGENQVGTTGGSNGIGITPLCDSDGSDQDGGEPEQAPRSQQMSSIWVDSHVAVAWHVKSDSVWATWGQRHAKTAKAIVLDACNATMGGGCTIASSAYNSSIAIARDEEGLLHGWGETADEAKLSVKKICKAQCKIEHVFTSEPWREPAYFGEIERKISDETGIHQQYFFPANSRIAPPNL